MEWRSSFKVPSVLKSESKGLVTDQLVGVLSQLGWFQILANAPWAIKINFYILMLCTVVASTTLASWVPSYTMYCNVFLSVWGVDAKTDHTGSGKSTKKEDSKKGEMYHVSTAEKLKNHLVLGKWLSCCLEYLITGRSQFILWDFSWYYALGFGRISGRRMRCSFKHHFQVKFLFSKGVARERAGGWQLTALFLKYPWHNQL